MEGFEVAKENVKRKRLIRLQDVDLESKLKQILGDKAVFRRRQEEVIRAIIKGRNPVIQVASTGEGKSLSFMLPAFYSGQGGVTVVVMPLVALKADMQRRLDKAGIDAHTWSRG